MHMSQSYSSTSPKLLTQSVILHLVAAKLTKLDIPDFIDNWMVEFLKDCGHQAFSFENTSRAKNGPCRIM